MEKRKPHHRLELVQALVRLGKVRATRTAIEGGVAMGFDFDGLLGVVLQLTMADFYKSMTTYHDSASWQDVYLPRAAQGKIYLKLTVQDGVLIVSFKEQ